MRWLVNLGCPRMVVTRWCQPCLVYRLDARQMCLPSCSKLSGAVGPMEGPVGAETGFCAWSNCGGSVPRVIFCSTWSAFQRLSNHRSLVCSLTLCSRLLPQTVPSPYSVSPFVPNHSISYRQSSAVVQVDGRGSALLFRPAIR